MRTVNYGSGTGLERRVFFGSCEKMTNSVTLACSPTGTAGTGLNELVGGLCVHSLRATAATNALQHDADIARVQDGSDTPASPPPASMTGAAPGPRKARRSG